MELTQKDIDRAIKCYAPREELELKYRCIKVKYNDGKTKRFAIDKWVIFCDGIKENIADKYLCKIRPVYKWSYLFSRLFKWKK